MSNFESNKKIAILIVDLVSKMYKLGDGVLVEFEPSSKFPNADVTAMTSKDYRIIFNIDRLAICPKSEVYVTAFHEMRHIYQYCCIELSGKFPNHFNEPKERIEKWKYNNLVGVLLAKMKGEKKSVKSIFKWLYVKTVVLIMNIFYKNTASVYDKANQEMFAKYKENNNPDGEIIFLASDPNYLGKGVGTFLLNELQRLEKNKTVYVYTDDQCVYQFYEHRGFIKEGEKDIIMEFDTDVNLKCMLFSKKL